jgi:hypothetical protein
MPMKLSLITNFYISNIVKLDKLKKIMKLCKVLNRTLINVFILFFIFKGLEMLSKWHNFVKIH